MVGRHTRPPGFYTFLGVEAPSSADLGIIPKNDTKISIIPPAQNTHALPLHRKQVVASLDYTALLEDTSDLPVHASLRNAYRWLSDSSIYEEVLRKNNNNINNMFQRPNSSKVRLPENDIHAWIEDGKVEEFHGTPRSFVHIFYVIEMFKRRRRGICEPFVNDTITKAMLAGIKLPTRRDVRRLLRTETHAVAIDAAAFYDQFALHKDVKPYFVFEFNGKMYTLSVLPMGFRPAADIAQLTAEAMLQLTQQKHALAYIDNFLFTGSNHKDDCNRFLRACEHYKLAINETPDWQWSDKLSVSRLEFIGEWYDLHDQVKASTDKTITKAARALEILNAYNHFVSAKTIAAVFGILIYASPSHDLRLCDKFTPMRYLGHLGRTTSDWSAPAPPIDNFTLTQLKEWAAEVIANPKTPIYQEVPDDHEIEIQVDASRWGWGALIINNDGSTKTVQQQWPSHFDASSSAIAEPQAAWLAICYAATKQTRKILLRSDHANLVFAFARGHSRTLAYNDCIQRVFSAFPQLTIVAQHIAGIDNTVADALSRNKTNSNG